MGQVVGPGTEARVVDGAAGVAVPARAVAAVAVATRAVAAAPAAVPTRVVAAVAVATRAVAVVEPVQGVVVVAALPPDTTNPQLLFVVCLLVAALERRVLQTTVDSLHRSTVVSS
jgi:hypothetical protein